MIESNKEQLGSLQIGRAVAALAVVGHHTALSVRDFIGPLPDSVQSALELGWAGVDFFFVLSGFIIYHSTYKREKGWQSARRYAAQRMIRVYTPYLTIGICVALGYLAVGGSNSRDWGMFASISLLPADRPPALSVAWTLQREIVFYAIFAIGLFSGRLIVALSIWTISILIGYYGAIGQEQPWFVLLAPINLEFIFGVIIAAAYTQGKLRNSRVPYFLGSLFLGLWIASAASRSNSVLLGLAIAAFMLPVVYKDSATPRRFHRHALLLGSASYALYLIHNPLISITTRIVLHYPWLARPWLAAVIGITSSVFIGIIYHLAFEKPATRLLRSKLMASGIYNQPKG